MKLCQTCASIELNKKRKTTCASSKKELVPYHLISMFRIFVHFVAMEKYLIQNAQIDFEISVVAKWILFVAALFVSWMTRAYYLG